MWSLTAPLYFSVISQLVGKVTVLYMLKEWEVTSTMILQQKARAKVNSQSLTPLGMMCALSSQKPFNVSGTSILRTEKWECILPCTLITFLFYEWLKQRHCSSLESFNENFQILKGFLCVLQNQAIFNILSLIYCLSFFCRRKNYFE